ncbi:MAG TPA: hypothetical protein VKU84_12730 [Stellaceae bacterium]|nr:hypothetical protein [Stellaceae bacterium]
MLLVAVPAFAGTARAQGSDSGAYCEPPPQTKLIYTNRAYLILPKPADAPPLAYSYSILGTERSVVRAGQFLFDDGGDRWAFESNPDGLTEFWPLKAQKHFDITRINRFTRGKALVSFVVEGTESINAAGRIYRSWRIRRTDHEEGGVTTTQLLWYSPDLCTLAAFTDSQQRTVTLLRVLKPGDRNYNRAIARRDGKMVFTDTGEVIK